MQGRHTPMQPAARSAPAGLRRVGAITWLSPDRAIVARRAATGWVDVAHVDNATPGLEMPYLAHVAHEIGDAERVVILGGDAVRTELEREYVRIYQRPDRIVDVEASEEVSEDALVERLRALPEVGPS
jgi:hypothetical protein